MTVKNPSMMLQELVVAASEGDLGAQSQLLEQYWPVIRYAVRGRKNRMAGGLAREETQDLEQDAAMRVLKELAGHQWQGASAFSAWIKKLAAHRVVDAVRYHAAEKRDNRAEVEADEHLPERSLRSAESVLDGKAQWQELLDDIAKLKPEHATALLMHHMGFTHGEVGEVLGCSEEAGRKLVGRAKVGLLKILDT
jgi:RNA polymerase sigma factor (sigma-70 family)